MKTRLSSVLCGLAGLLAAIPAWAKTTSSPIAPASSTGRSATRTPRRSPCTRTCCRCGGGTGPSRGSAPAGLSPDVVRTAYGLPLYALGQTQGTGTIVIVDAYDYPTAVADLNAFSKQFGLPQEPGRRDEAAERQRGHDLLAAT